MKEIAKLLNVNLGDYFKIVELQEDITFRLTDYGLESSRFVGDLFREDNRLHYLFNGNWTIIED